MRKSFGTALVTTALVAATLTGGTAFAGSAETVRSTPVAAAAVDCSSYLSPVKAKETVKIRTAKRLNATALGIWGKGRGGDVCNDGRSQAGESYRLCGKSSNQWYYGRVGSIKGWVPATCIPA
ncbi:hypothetical protein JNUCC64_13465 [Streptomyces sp. JNUCC 64]